MTARVDLFAEDVPPRRLRVALMMQQYGYFAAPASGRVEVLRIGTPGLHFTKNGVILSATKDLLYAVHPG
jgi:hypothetical protein